MRYIGKRRTVPLTTDGKPRKDPFLVRLEGTEGGKFLTALGFETTIYWRGSSLYASPIWTHLDREVPPVVFKHRKALQDILFQEALQIMDGKIKVGNAQVNDLNDILHAVGVSDIDPRWVRWRYFLDCLGVPEFRPPRKV